MDRSAARQLLGCKDAELVDVSEVDGVTVLVTADGQAYEVRDGRAVRWERPAADAAGVIAAEPDPDPTPRRRRRGDG